MLVAFIGTHIPLLSLLVYAVNATNLPPDAKTRTLLVALCATLLGTAATLYILQKLLLPVTLTFKGLRQYLERSEIPLLPTEFSDEAGILMADTLQTITKLDDLIHQLRDFDPVTNLPNRTFFQATLEQALQTASRQQRQIAITVLDIDDFAAVNNSYGPGIGDRLLLLAAGRLRLTMCDGDTLSRIGSDEFAILQATDGDASEDVYEQARRMSEVFEQPFVVDEQSIRLTASVGIAFESAESGTMPMQAEQVLGNADTALRSAKEDGRNGLRFFASNMNDALRHRLEIERELHAALDREELRLFYQPQIDMQSGKITGVEALLRWENPTRGWISPGEFIPIAEQSGLIIPIGDWVLKTACHDNRRWNEAGHPRTRVAVNLSPRQFQEANLLATVRAALQETQLDPELLELEITESAILQDAQRSTHSMNELRALGIQLSLDDFGTGYSSLSYLKRFPLNRLKIDQSFVCGVPHDTQDLAITQSVIALARSLQMETIAEGVETQQQVDCLRENGCDHMQGFYFARALPVPELLRVWETVTKP